MEDLSHYFNNCSVTPNIEMNEMLASVNEIDQEIKINNLGVLIKSGSDFPTPGSRDRDIKIQARGGEAEILNWSQG